MTRILLSEDEIEATVNALADQIFAAHKETPNLCLIGITEKGYALAKRLSKKGQDLGREELIVGYFDAALYRDDYHRDEQFVSIQKADIPVDLTGKTVILVDDVLFHGRMTRAALEGISDYGQAEKIELAVLIDRGHRQLPVMANYIGVTLETKRDAFVELSLYEHEAEDVIKIKETVPC